MKNIFSYLLILCCAFICLTANAAENKTVLSNPIIAEFIDDMVKQHNFDKNELHNLFSQVEVLPEIIERMNRPAEAWPWHRYRNLFIKQDRIEQGVAFWRENEELLKRAEEKYGVPAEIIVAILGVETRYGRHKGKFRLLDSLTTLVIDYPKRRKFFKKELEQVLLLARDEGFDPLSLKGSYAGAMGKAQFIASSYRHYAVDFNGDGVRDLLNSTEDAVGSIASYLARHGWQAGEPITAKANVTGEKYKKLVQKGLKPKVEFAKLSDYGVQAGTKFDPSLKTALIELEQTEEAKEHWIVLRNFYAITRYNHSQLYAMAAYQLGQNIKELKNKGV